MIKFGQEVGMEIGRPVRTIIVEPLELPEPLRPAEEPRREEQPEPEMEPLRHGEE